MSVGVDPPKKKEIDAGERGRAHKQLVKLLASHYSQMAESSFREKNATYGRNVDSTARPQADYICINFKWNQHTKPPFPTLYRQVYEDLIRSCRTVKSPGDTYECWIPDSTRRRGIELQPTGYTRINFDGSDVQTHVFVYLYWRPKHRTAADISHLCGEASCCNPQHLVEENRDLNLARRGCPGVIVDSVTDSKYRLCRHQPPCCRSTTFNSVTDALE